MEQIEFLRKVPLFAALEDGELKLIAGLTDQSHAEAGRVLAQQGEVGQAFVIIVEGKARVESKGKALRQLSTGDYFGEISLLDEHPRTASVIATTDLQLMSISKGRFTYLLDQFPQLTMKLLLALCKYLRKAEERLSEQFWL